MGSSAHALWWPGTADGETCLLFLPGKVTSASHNIKDSETHGTGNPGLVDFYTPYLTAIHEKAQHKLCILAHSFIGHTPGIDESNKDVSKICLTSQIEAVIEVVDTMKSHYRKLVIVGHSAGSWVTLQVYRKSRI